jgi:MFS family permease
VDEPFDARRPDDHHPHPGRVVAVLAVAGLGSSFVFTAIIPIQAHLPDLFASGREQTAWAVTATLLVAAVLTPISGRLADMIGKRRVALALLALLALGSVVSAGAQELWMLVLGRGLQGAATGIMPVGIAILRDTVPARRLDTSIALMSATLGVGGGLGLPISAIVNQLAGWRWTFGATAVFAAVVAALVVAVVPESGRSGGRFDALGAAGLALVTSALLVLLSFGATWGWTSPATLLTSAAALIVLAGWVWHESRTRDPLLDLRLARSRPVLMTNLTSFAVGFSLFASNIVYPQLLEMPQSAGGFGLSLIGASVVMMPPGVIMLTLAPVAGALSSRFGPRTPLLIGAAFLTAAYGYGLLFSSEIWQIVVTNVLIGVGVGFGYAAIPALIMRAVPEHAAGASNGLNTLFRSLGTSVASASIGAVLAVMSRTVGGTTVPTPGAFHVAILFGLIASAVALVLATAIPRPTRRGCPAPFKSDAPRTAGAGASADEHALAPRLPLERRVRLRCVVEPPPVGEERVEVDPPVGDEARARLLLDRRERPDAVHLHLTSEQIRTHLE